MGIATQEEFLEHLFTCRAQAVQANINNQIIAKAKLEDALDYEIDNKRIWFRENLNKLRISYYEDSITLVLSRDNVLGNFSKLKLANFAFRGDFEPILHCRLA